MRIFGISSDLWLYSMVGVVGGIGIGIMFSNIYPFSFEIGLIIALVSIIYSVYIWNIKLKRVFYKADQELTKKEGIPDKLTTLFTLVFIVVGLVIMYFSLKNFNALGMVLGLASIVLGPFIINFIIKLKNSLEKS